MLWSEMERLGRVFDPWFQVGRLNRPLRWTPLHSTVDFPPTNVWVTDDSAMVTTEVPGIDPATLEITVVKDSLVLRGSRATAELKEGEFYHRRERWHGQFTKTLELPFAVEANKVEARFAKGVLHISLPRAEAEKPRKIAVKSD